MEIRVLKKYIIVVGTIGVILLITAIVFPIMYSTQKKQNAKPKTICNEATVSYNCDISSFKVETVKGTLSQDGTVQKGTIDLTKLIKSHTSNIQPSLDSTSLLLTTTQKESKIDYSISRDKIYPMCASNVFLPDAIEKFGGFSIARQIGNTDIGLFSFSASVIAWTPSASVVLPFNSELNVEISREFTSAQFASVIYTLKGNPILPVLGNSVNMVMYKSFDTTGTDWGKEVINLSEPNSVIKNPVSGQTADRKTSAVCTAQFASSLTMVSTICIYVSDDDFVTNKSVKVVENLNLRGTVPLPNLLVLSNDEARVIVAADTGGLITVNVYWSKVLDGPYSILNVVNVPSLPNPLIFAGLFEDDTIAIFSQNTGGGNSSYLITSTDDFKTSVSTTNLFNVPIGTNTNINVFFVYLPGGERRIYLSTIGGYCAFITQTTRNTTWDETEIFKGLGKRILLSVQQVQNQPCALLAFSVYLGSTVAAQMLGSLADHSIETASVTSK